MGWKDKGGVLMISVRRNVFETNSSSTHSITMCSENEYDKWRNGELLYKRWSGEFKTKEQILEEAKKTRESYLEEQAKGKKLYHYQEEYVNAQTDEELLEIVLPEEDSEWCTYEEYWDWMDDSYYQTFEDDYTTKGGEKVIAFGYHGYDG